MSYHQDQAPQLPQQSPQQPPTRYPPNQWWSMPQQEIMPSYIPPQLEQQFPQQSQYGQPQSGQQPLPQYEQPYQTRYGWQPVMNYPSPQQFEQIAGQQTKKESLLLPRSAREREGRDDQQGWLAKTTTQADLVCEG